MVIKIHSTGPTRKIADLVPYARNARTHSDAQINQLVASLEEWGFTNPVLIDESGGIIAGHGRVLAAERAGMSAVPVVEVAGLSEAQRRALVIADNKLALNAGWDMDLLGAELQELGELGFSLDLVGFDELELDALLGNAEEIEMPALATGDREPFQTVSFTLHDSQVLIVKDALKAAKKIGPFDGPNENSNGNALARICELFRQ